MGNFAFLSLRAQLLKATPWQSLYYGVLLRKNQMKKDSFLSAVGGLTRSVSYVMRLLRSSCFVDSLAKTFLHSLEDTPS